MARHAWKTCVVSGPRYYALTLLFHGLHCTCNSNSRHDTLRLPRSLPRTPPSTGSCVELLSWSSHKVRQPSDPPWPLMAGLLRLNSRKLTPQGLHRDLKREG